MRSSSIIGIETNQNVVDYNLPRAYYSASKTPPVPLKQMIDCGGNSYPPAGGGIVQFSYKTYDSI